jgi:hypothetical protein
MPVLDLTIQYSGLQLKEKMRRKKENLPGRRGVQHCIEGFQDSMVSRESSGSVAADQGESRHKNEIFAPSPVIRCD